MGDRRLLETCAGPCQNMVDAAVAQADRMLRGGEPALKSAMMAGLETTGLVSRRLQAYVELPHRIAHCRTPEDLLNAQAGFWQTALEQYVEAGERMMAAWSAAASVPMVPWIAEPGLKPETERADPSAGVASRKAKPNGAARPSARSRSPAPEPRSWRNGSEAAA